MTEHRLDGYVAVVSGGASGIGAATVIALARYGARTIHLIDIDAAGAQAAATAAEHLGATVVTHHGDVSNPDMWNDIAAHVERDGGRLDVLVNNAYTARVAPLLEQSAADWDQQIAVNLSSVFYACRSLLPILMTSRGNIVNVASVHAFVGLPGYPAYAASKGALVSLSRQLAVEYGSMIRVNAISPGPILTAAWDDNTQDERDQSASATALGRLGEPMDVAESVCFLASPQASFITGTNLVVDGGWLAKKDSA